jgi:hypothetical protein
MHRDARAEAAALVGDDLEPFVLEPSPPAVPTPPFAADDPLDLDRATGRRPLVPAGHPGHHTWDDWLAEHPEHDAWVRERWLGGRRRLPDRPVEGYAESLRSLHRLGAYVIAPLRHATTGKFGLRYTHGGFGTPFFGDDRQVRVTGDTIVDQLGSQVRTIPITTLRAAADALGGEVSELTRESDGPAAGDVDEPLLVDARVTAYLGEWYAMATAALERLRATHPEAGRPQLWPGHFDVALEVGEAPLRGSYGASPGDHAIDEPYLYVSVWDPTGAGIERGTGPWNATGFPGRELRLSQFPDDTDPVDVAWGFWTETYTLLTSHLSR